MLDVACERLNINEMFVILTEMFLDTVSKWQHIKDIHLSQGLICMGAHGSSALVLHFFQ